jgi:hypothetical protein
MQLLIETCEFPNNTSPREKGWREGETNARYSIATRDVCQHLAKHLSVAESLRFRTKFPHGQSRPSIHVSIRCFSHAIATLEAPFLRRFVRCPRTTVGLQESHNLLFGKTGALHVEISFRNAPAISKEHLVKIAIFMVKNADSSVVAQTSLHQVAVCVINSVAAVTQISPAARRGCENRQENDAELLHIVSVDHFAEICNRARAILSQKRRIVLEFPATT